MAEPTIQLGGGNWAGKTDNLLGYYKEGERFYKQDFTFSRSTTGTYTDKDGYIQEMPYNLLEQSNDFDTTWTLSASIDLTSGQSGYDGSNDAWLLKRNSTGSRYVQQTLTRPSGQYSFSVYLKAESTDWVYIWAYDGSTAVNAYFDLNNGVVGNTSGLDSTNVVSVGNGWYRCSITFTQAITSVRIYPAYANGSIATGTDNGIYIQDAQINKGTSAKTYFPTTTRLNMPRVSYKDNSNGSLILEPQRSNLVTYSSDFSQWSNARTTDTANQITSPDGLNNGTLFEQQSGQTNAGSIYFSVSLSSGTYTQSIFAKKKDKDFIVCYSANAERTYFNLSNGTIGTIASGNTAKIEDYGNGWYRCTITYTITSGSVIAFYLSDSDNSSVVTDSGGVYIYGAQLEVGSYPTTLINTSGSSVTRNADACSLTNVADKIGQTEGTMFVEINYTPITLSSSFSVLYIGEGTYANAIYLSIEADGNLYALAWKNGTREGIINMGALPQGINKIALSYEIGSLVAFLNGVNKGSDTPSALPSSNKVYLGQTGTTTYLQKTNVLNAKLYNTRLSNSELAELTTI